MVDIVVGNDMLGMMIADELGVPKLNFVRYYHPDGAAAPTVDMRYGINDYESVEGKELLTVYRRKWMPTRDEVSRHMLNYFRLVHNLVNEETFNAEAVDVLFPYWISGRQDHNPRHDPDPDVRRRDKGRGVDYKSDATFLEAAGARRVLTFHPHFHREPGTIKVNGLEVVCLDAVPAMVKFAVDELGISGDCLVVTPDLKPAKEGKYDIAKAFAELAEREYGAVGGVRVSADDKVATTELDAEGRDVVIVDDIFSTLSTIESGVRNIRNPRRVDVIGVHGVFTRDAGINRVNRLLHDPDSPVGSITCTHTIEGPYAKIPIWDEVADFYKGHSEGE